MKSSWSRCWMVPLVLGYLLFYAAHFTETAYSTPRGINTACYGMMVPVMKRLDWGLLHDFAAGPCQRHPHLSLLFFVPAVLLLALGYLAALRAVARRPEAWSLPRLALVAGVSALPLLPMLPPTSSDYLDYIFSGRVLSVYQMSPWQHALGSFPAEHDYIGPFIWGPDLRCVYGPVSVAVMAATTGIVHLLMPGDVDLTRFLLNVVLLRLAAVAALAAAAAAVWQIQGLLFPRRRQLVTAAFLLNPLLVYEGVGALHNDLWGAALLLWTCLLFLRNDARFAIALALCVLTKYTAVCIAPFLGAYLWRCREWRQLGALLAALLLCFGLAQLTFTEYLAARLLGNAAYTQLSMPVWLGLAAYMTGVTPAVTELAPVYFVVSKILAALFVPVCLSLIWRVRSREQAIAHGMIALALYLSCVYSQTMQWYFLWPLALLFALPWTKMAASAAWGSCAILLSYLAHFWDHNSGAYDAYSVFVQALSFLLAAGASALIALAGRPGAGAVPAAQPEEQVVPEQRHAVAAGASRQ